MLLQEERTSGLQKKAIYGSTPDITTTSNQGDTILPELSGLWENLETRRRKMITPIERLSPEQIRFQLQPDRRSILQVLQQVVSGKEGMRRSEVGLRNNPLREILRPGKSIS